MTEDEQDRLRAREEAGAAVVRAWRDAPDDVEPRSGIGSAWPELAAVLDELVRVHTEVAPLPGSRCTCVTLPSRDDPIVVRDRWCPVHTPGGPC